MLLELLKHLINPLVDHPDKVQVDHLDTEKVDIFLVSVPQGDRGHVLGREGKTADEIRNLMQYAAELFDREVVIDILD